MSRPNSDESGGGRAPTGDAQPSVHNGEAGTSSFDPYDWQSFYFGNVSRLESEQMLDRRGVLEGMFLVRDSNTHPGSYVLSVREESKTGKQFTHYLVNRVPLADADGCVSPGASAAGGSSQQQCRFRMGERTFVDFGQVLNFYKSHALETCQLSAPVPRHFCRARAAFDFDGQEAVDLSFKKGDILYILQQSDPHWWCAKNELGRSGQIPAVYVTICDDGDSNNGQCDDEVNSNGAVRSDNDSQSHSNRTSGSVNNADAVTVNAPMAARTSSADVDAEVPRALPCQARAVLSRTPCLYDATQLALRIGDILQVTAVDQHTGMYDAVSVKNGKCGKVPCTYIEWL